MHRDCRQTTHVAAEQLSLKAISKTRLTNHGIFPPFLSPHIVQKKMYLPCIHYKKEDGGDEDDSND